MSFGIEGLHVLRSAFKAKCSKTKPCFLVNQEQADFPCCRCLMQLIDADEWLHDDHCCRGPECSGETKKTDSKAGLGRRTQHYGYEFNYKVKHMLKKTKPFSNNRAIELLGEILSPNFPDGKVPDQCIINEYRVGQSIGPHIDKPCFGPVVISVSLLGGCRMTFTGQGKKSVTLDLTPGDIVLLEGEARADYEHSIERIRVKDVDPADKRRVSATYRTSV